MTFASSELCTFLTSNKWTHYLALAALELSGLNKLGGMNMLLNGYQNDRKRMSKLNTNFNINSNVTLNFLHNCKNEDPECTSSRILDYNDL